MSAAKEAYIVFRNGKWIQCEFGQDDIPNITTKMKWELASAYGTAKAKGFSEEKARIFAEMYIYKKKFSDLQYSSELEAEYRKLFF